MQKMFSEKKKSATSIIVARVTTGGERNRPSDSVYGNMSTTSFHTYRTDHDQDNIDHADLIDHRSCS